MSLSTHDPLDTDADLDLPEAMAAVLVDLGLACNAAVVAITRAQTIELSDREAATVVSATRPPLPWWQRTIGNLTLSALTYVDMLTVEYAIVAVNYAAHAARVAVDLLAERHPQIPGTESVLPSQLLADPDGWAPLVQIPPTRFERNVATENNQHLTAAHRELVDVITQRLRSPTTEYDDIALAAHRHAGATDLVLEFPAALHRYAAALASAIQLIASA